MKTGPGKLSLEDSRVVYAGLSKEPTNTFSVLCSEFPSHVSLLFSNRLMVTVPGALYSLQLSGGSHSKDVFVEVMAACAASEKETAKRRAEAAGISAQANALRQKELEEEETRRIAQWRAESAANFHDGILAALRAAEESDPFASIRGDFDLSATDSRQWKTSFTMPNAEKCVLLKAPAPPPAVGSFWTLACISRASKVEYEDLVKSVQSVLNVPYQPDEQEPANVNQVFFADPSRPTWRLFVTKFNEGAVGISVVATRLAGGAVPNLGQLPGVPVVSPREPTVRDEVEKIRSGRYAPLPPAQGSAANTGGMSGRTTMTIRNSTAYELSVFYDGPISNKLTLAPGASQELDLAPGRFRVAGRVAAANVLPFYGEESYGGSTRYSVEFYIGPKQ
jgi:hypothetical protein